MTPDVTLVTNDGLMSFEKGMTLAFPLDRVERDPFCPRGVAYVSHVDRVRGVITAAIGDYETILMNPRDYEALRRELDRGFDAMRDSFSNALYRNGGPALTPMQVGIAASVTLAGLGWIIARRNLLAGEQDSASWAAGVVAWVMALVRGLLGLKEREPDGG